jgi:hypothetical protein
MDLTIDENTINSTHSCRHDFACLREEGRDIRRVLAPMGDDYVFIEPAGENWCPYRKTFGYTGTYCACPVRTEIYKRYAI